ncbi:amino acid ABC transporter substrate-binding protein [Achromobacter spanius]|uniref:amino acid ABC transporter substrate-binding protein n=1 Tax=Achromobacter spanius TaxID=217203 RepID=UPI00382EA5BA
MKRLHLLAAAILTFNLVQPAQAGTTFDTVKNRGFVQCGVSTDLPGFASIDSKGEWRGIDAETCRAIAVTMFGDAKKSKLVPLTTQARFTALQSGEVDVLTRNTTQTMSRDTTLGLMGAGVNYYDSLGLMVKSSLGVKSAKELNDAAVCVLPGTTTELNLADWFRAQGLKFKPVVLDRYEEIVRAFSAGRCDAITLDRSALAATRSNLGKAADYVILPETLSKEPLGPMVRQGDDRWFNVVRWTLNALLEAEEYGITQSNVDEMLKSTNPNVQRILGVTPGLGKNLGVDDKWVYFMVKQLGNYGEIFDRTLGKKSPLELDRGLNALYLHGGIMYGTPLR